MSSRSLQGHYAGAVTRATAFVVDIVVITVTVAVVSWLTVETFGLVGINVQSCPETTIRGRTLGFWVCHLTRWSLALFAALTPIVYWLFFWTVGGQTIGMRVMGLRVVRLDAKPMTLMRSARRYIGFIACFLTLGLGFAPVLVNDRRQGLHDQFAGTTVIYAWKAEQNEFLVERLNAWLARRGKNAAQLSAQPDPHVPPPA